MRSCCGKTIRQGLFIGTLLQTAVFATNMSLMLYFFLSPNLISVAPMISEFLFPSVGVIAIAVFGLTIGGGFMIVFMSPTSGLSSAVKILAVLQLCSAGLWVAFAFILGLRMNYLFYNLLPPSRLLQNTMKEHIASGGKGSPFKLFASLMFGMALNPFFVEAYRMTLGEPLYWIIYLGANLFYPLFIFGIPVLVVCMATVPVTNAYANILVKGGDGSEYVEAERIEWFYNLPKALQDKIKDNQGYISSSSEEDQASDEDDEDSSERGSSSSSGKQRPARRRAKKGGKTLERV